MVKRIADKYANICGYRQHGLKYDDLLCEENDTVQKVIEQESSLLDYSVQDVDACILFRRPSTV